MKFSPTITNWKKETLIIYPWPCVFKRSEYKKEKQHAFFALNIYNKVLCLYLNQRHLRVRTGTVSSYPGLIKWTQRSNERGMCKEINFYRPHADFAQTFNGKHKKQLLFKQNPPSCFELYQKSNTLLEHRDLLAYAAVWNSCETTWLWKPESTPPSHYNVAHAQKFDRCVSLGNLISSHPQLFFGHSTTLTMEL